MKSQFEKLGAELVYIAAEKRDGIWKPAKYLAENPVSYPFLLDEDRGVTKAYGLYNAFSHDAFRVAYPATLVVDQEAMVRYIYRGGNQADRAPVEQVIEGVRSLKGQE
jgi:peroxiredoxin